MKKAVVIGASSGIGKDLAAILIEKGYQVAITGRRLEALEAIKRTHPGAYLVFQHDVTDAQQNTKVFEKIVKALGTVDLFIYSSGIGTPNYTLAFEHDLPTIQTNILGATQCYNLAYNLFKSQGFGHLVGISSIASIRGNRHVPTYFASKAYQASYFESLWLKARRSKLPIFITDIQPGFVDTPMALGKTFWMASSEKASQQIYKAIVAKKKKAYITKRWALIAFVLTLVPAKLFSKFF